MGRPHLKKQEADGQILLYNFPKNRDKKQYIHTSLILSKVLWCILSDSTKPNESINMSEDYKGSILKENGVNPTR